MLQVPIREQSGQASTKAVILVSDAILSPAADATDMPKQVGGPSRGTRFRPLSLDVPKVCTDYQFECIYSRRTGENLTKIPRNLAPVRSRRSPHHPPLLEGSRQVSRCP